LGRGAGDALPGVSARGQRRDGGSGAPSGDSSPARLSAADDAGEPVRQLAARWLRRLAGESPLPGGRRRRRLSSGHGGVDGCAGDSSPSRASARRGGRAVAGSMEPDDAAEGQRLHGDGLLSRRHDRLRCPDAGCRANGRAAGPVAMAGRRRSHLRPGGRRPFPNGGAVRSLPARSRSRRDAAARGGDARAHAGNDLRHSCRIRLPLPSPADLVGASDVPLGGAGDVEEVLVAGVAGAVHVPGKAVAGGERKTIGPAVRRTVPQGVRPRRHLSHRARRGGGGGAAAMVGSRRRGGGGARC